MMRLRQLLTKACSLLSRLFVVFHVSQPYNSMVFIMELNSLIFVLREMVPVLQMVPIILNTVLALPILVLISNSEPPVLSTTLPRYLKLSTSSSARPQ